MRSSLVVSFLLAVSIASAGEIKTVSFVACPVYRDVDAGRKSGCWLATDRASGTRYDVSDSPIKPILGREILIEGVLTNAPDTCGGITLKPVRVSVLPTQCQAFMLPAEGFPSRPFVLPAAVLQPTFAKREPLTPPFGHKEWRMYFELNSDFLLYQHSEVILDEIAHYVAASRPSQIVVTAFAAEKPTLVSGIEIKETAAIAKNRAAMVLEAFSRLNIPRELVKVSLQSNASIAGDALAAEGLAGAAQRRVTIAIDW